MEPKVHPSTPIREQLIVQVKIIYYSNESRNGGIAIRDQVEKGGKFASQTPEMEAAFLRLKNV